MLAVGHVRQRHAYGAASGDSLVILDRYIVLSWHGVMIRGGDTTFETSATSRSPSVLERLKKLERKRRPVEQ